MLTASDSSGCAFTGWSGCAQGGNAPSLVPSGIDGTMTCTANFSRRSDAITGRAATVEGGVVSCNDRRAPPQV
jgi:dihydroorotase-like cyclic amidohydrolase